MATTATPATPNMAAVEVPPMTEAQKLMYERRWIALLLLSLSLVLIVADSTIVNIAFPSIRKTFGASFADAEWVNSIYSLVFGAALITFGKLGDQYGRRRIFILGAITFLVGSVGTGFASSIGMMIAFRAVQGLGAAMMSPSTLSIISATFKGRERGAAFGVWGASAGVAAAIGPILGGFLITNGTSITPDSWRLAFLINVPIGIIAIIGSVWAIQETLDNTTKHHIDVIGIVLASLALGSIVFGAIEGQNYGWLTAKKVFTLGPITYPQLADGVTAIPANTTSFIPFMFLVGIVLLALFVLVELRQESSGGEPLFEFGMLRYKSFGYGLLTILIVALGEFGVILALSIFFQLAKNLDAFQSGLRFLPFAIATFVTAPTAGQLSSRFGAKWVVTAGMVCEAIALFLLSQTMYADERYLVFVPIFLLYGVGVGLAIAQLANIVLSDIPSEKAGVGSGATNTIRQLGASLGIAIIGAVLFGTFADQAKPLITKSTAFEDFGVAAKADTTLSKADLVVANLIASSGATVKKAINAGLDANEGFDTNNTDVVGQVFDKVPAIAFSIQGVNINEPGLKDKIKADLKPYSDKLSAALQNALATGFSTAARTAASVAALFVLGGAVCSLLLPNTRPKWGATAAVAAH